MKLKKINFIRRKSSIIIKLLTIFGLLCLLLFSFAYQIDRIHSQCFKISKCTNKIINNISLNSVTKTANKRTVYLKNIKFKTDDTLVIGFPKSGKLYQAYHK